jgi:hypothetical protein
MCLKICLQPPAPRRHGAVGSRAIRAHARRARRARVREPVPSPHARGLHVLEHRLGLCRLCLPLTHRFRRKRHRKRISRGRDRFLTDYASTIFHEYLPPIFIFLIFNKTPTAHSMAAHGMDLLMQNEGALLWLLARFTQHDANCRLGAVCRALHAACAWQHVPWIPFTCLAATLLSMSALLPTVVTVMLMGFVSAASVSKSSGYKSFTRL